MNSRRWLWLILLSCVLALPVMRAVEANYTIAVIPMGTTHEYWKLIHEGALNAQAPELKAQGVNVDIIWKGPLREDDRDHQVQVVENFIGRPVSGMVLAPLDHRALVAPVEQAAAAGIPIAIVDSGLDSKAPVSYIATDNHAGGQLAARRLGELLHGKGNVILLRVQVGSGSCEAREAGFLEELAAKFPGIKVISSTSTVVPRARRRWRRRRTCSTASAPK